MTGTTRAAPTTLRLDTGDIVVERRIHDGLIGFNRYREPAAGSSKESEVGHVFVSTTAIDCPTLERDVIRKAQHGSVGVLDT